MNQIAADPESLQSRLDVAMISIDRVTALTGLLAVEDVAAAFARLSSLEQVAIFGCIEADLHKAREALLRAAGCDDGTNVRRPGS
ncbi:hypothetical protein GWC77_26090 [Paraburkholderia sp. NMBU_R16]|uniref:hypothetical protein n=1 Tax=Paraburkholderia sp. NMBU_R16 TaxID=2698676 RepID=UPI0015653EE5|nr:hypothetical protein [Paraburkholderia sp. NMBU_R16]NRO99357.1 hypothetical protein [Paraburkholderia sp. NMBU_R16]